MINKRTLQLKGIPTLYVATDYTKVKFVSPASFNKESLKFKTTHSLFMYNDDGAMIDKLLKDETITIPDILGVNYVEAFTKLFDKDSNNELPKSKLLYVFNIGAENTNTHTFSDKVLANILRTNKSWGNSTILVSNIVTPTIFTRQYPLTNSLLDNKIQGIKYGN